MPNRPGRKGTPHFRADGSIEIERSTIDAAVHVCVEVFGEVFVLGREGEPDVLHDPHGLSEQGRLFGGPPHDPGPRFRWRIEQVFKSLHERKGARGAVTWFAERSGYSYENLRRMYEGKVPVSPKAEAVLGELEIRARAIAVLRTGYEVKAK